MTTVNVGENGIVVDAQVLADAFRISEAELATLMRSGRITSRCETGVDDDVDHWRLTFFLNGRAFRFTVDRTGTILRCGSFPAPVRRQSQASPPRRDGTPADKALPAERISSGSEAEAAPGRR